MEKYIAIIVGVFLLAMFGVSMVESYTRGQCRTEALKQNKSAEDIQKICK